MIVGFDLVLDGTQLLFYILRGASDLQKLFAEGDQAVRSLVIFRLDGLFLLKSSACLATCFLRVLCRARRLWFSSASGWELSSTGVASRRPGPKRGKLATGVVRQPSARLRIVLRAASLGTGIDMPHVERKAGAFKPRPKATLTGR